MSSNTKLYDIIKELQTLHTMHAKQQQSNIIKSKLELRNAIRECLKQIDDIAKIPATFCDNASEEQNSKEPHMKIDRKAGKHLLEVKNKIGQLFEEVQAEEEDAVFPMKLENWADDFRLELQEHKDQLRRKIFLAGGFERMPEHILSSDT